MNENERWPKAIRVPEKIETTTPPDKATIDKLKRSTNFYNLAFFIFIFIIIFSFVLSTYLAKYEQWVCYTLFLIGVLGSFVTGVIGNELKRKIKRKQLLIEHKKLLAEQQQILRSGAKNISLLTPIQFEKYCGILLNDNGWQVDYTATTGDYGADIIATKNGVKMVVQCKHYNGNVGVSAVQEAFSAMSYYHAQKACVVASRGGFTKAAKSLALRTGVEVMCPGELK